MIDRNEAMLIASASIIARALQQMEHNAVETVRRDINFGVRRRVGRGRRLVRDTSALVRLLLAIAILVQQLRALQSRSAGRDDKSAAPDPIGT